MKKAILLTAVAVLSISISAEAKKQRRHVASDYCAGTAFAAGYGVIKSFANIKKSDVTNEIVEQGARYTVSAGANRYNIVVDPINPNEGTCTVVSVTRDMAAAPAAPAPTDAVQAN